MTTYTTGEAEWSHRIATLEHMLAEERARVAELEGETLMLREQVFVRIEDVSMFKRLYEEQIQDDNAARAELEAEVAVLRPWSVMLKRAHGALTDAGCVVPLEFDQSIEHAINDLARRATRAEQLFVDECNAHQETRKLLTDLYMKQLRADAAQMREYGISYDGVRTLLAEYDGGELSLGKVLELLRAAARELAKEEIAELKARIAVLEAMR